MAGSTQPTFFVTGAAGHFGRRVTELLLDAQVGTVVAGTRSPERIADLAARGAETRPADFDDPASLDAAFAGVDKLLIVSTDALASPRATCYAVLREPGNGGLDLGDPLGMDAPGPIDTHPFVEVPQHALLARLCDQLPGDDSPAELLGG